jgi:hypothetical protein
MYGTVPEHSNTLVFSYYDKKIEIFLSVMLLNYFPNLTKVASSSSDPDPVKRGPVPHTLADMVSMVLATGMWLSVCKNVCVKLTIGNLDLICLFLLEKNLDKIGDGASRCSKSQLGIPSKSGGLRGGIQKNG